MYSLTLLFWLITRYLSSETIKIVWLKSLKSVEVATTSLWSFFMMFIDSDFSFSNSFSRTWVRITFESAWKITKIIHNITLFWILQIVICSHKFWAPLKIWYRSRITKYEWSTINHSSVNQKVKMIRLFIIWKIQILIKTLKESLKITKLGQFPIQFYVNFTWFFDFCWPCQMSVLLHPFQIPKSKI